jgi:prepilin-type N-terminal cleavage/methylation domain-containing protein
MKRSAFTLIELLVVMAIVALLAALIIAAVNNGMEAAQGAKDMANLREVGKGVMVLPERQQRRFLPSRQYGRG